MAQSKRVKSWQKISKLGEKGEEVSDNCWKDLSEASSTFFHFEDDHHWAVRHGNEKWQKIFLDEMIKRPKKLGHFRTIARKTPEGSAEWENAIQKAYAITKKGEVLDQWIQLRDLLPEGHELELEAFRMVSKIRSAKRRKKVGSKHWQVYDEIKLLISTEKDIPEGLWKELSDLRKNFQQLVRNYVLACKVGNIKWRRIFLDNMVKEAKSIQEYRILARKSGKDSPACIHAMLNIHKMTKGKDILYRWRKFIQMLDRYITINSKVFVGMRSQATQEISRLKKEKKPKPA